MLASEKGFTIVELLIGIAIVGIVLTGIYNLAISSSQIYLAQNGIVQMQADARAAMDFMARELRAAITIPKGKPEISTKITTNDTISFNRVEETGYSTGGNSASTLNDTDKVWQAGDFAPTSTSEFKVWILSGTGSGQDPRKITGNSATQLTISEPWDVTPDKSSRYIITSNKGFTRISGTDNVLRYRIGATGQNNPLAENITSHAFSQPDPKTITITLTARTSSPDPTTKQYRYYTLTESVNLRN
jgi:prepilin-type N-terminal cleavage/methylation domain-containing protein